MTSLNGYKPFFHLITFSIEGKVFILARIRKVSNTHSSVEVVTFEEAKAIVIRNKELEGSREETIRNYGKFFRHFYIFLKENSINNMKDLTEQDVKSFMYYLITSGLQNVTVNSYLNNAKGSFKVLAEEGLCNHEFQIVRYHDYLLNCQVKNLQGSLN